MEDIIAVFIPIVAIIMGIGVAMLGLYFKHRQRDMIHKERLAAIEKGIEPPPIPDGFFGTNRTDRSPSVYLLRGLIWFFLGIGIMAGLYWAHPELRQGAALGVIPLGIGIAYLIFYLVERKEAKQDTPDEPQSH